MQAIDLRAVEGFAIGHAQDAEAATGVTVVLAEAGAAAGVDVRGGGPATRETDLLRPENMVQAIHAVCLSGGSAFGLAAASGVMEFLEARGVGFETGVARVPIVCGASLFDLGVGSATVRPGAHMGRAACEAALGCCSGPLEGNVGAGCGASVGKLLGPAQAMKSGIGCAAVQLGSLQVGAIIACNAAGNVMAEDGSVLAGARGEGGEPLQLPALMAAMAQAVADPAAAVMNTTIGCILTNARLTKAECTKLASTAHDGLARAIKPVHLSMDGDTLFAMASGKAEAPFDLVAMLAAQCVEDAVRRSVMCAAPAHGLPGLAAVQ